MQRGVSINGASPIVGWFIFEDPIKIDGSGVPHVRKPPYAYVFVGFAFPHLKYWNILNYMVVKFNQNNMEIQQQEHQIKKKNTSKTFGHV